MSQPVIFVGGIHGAGKTTISRRLAVALPALHVTAGELIRETGNSGTTLSGINNKAVSDVDGNQELLLQGLALYRGHADRPIVLDGHFSLIQPDGAVVTIPLAVYIQIAPIAIVLIESDSVIVHSRLVERDGTAPPLETITSLSGCERVHALAVSAALKIPIFVVRGDVSADGASCEVASELFSLLRGAT